MNPEIYAKEDWMIYEFASKEPTKFTAERDALQQAVDNGIERLKVLEAEQKKGGWWLVTVEGRDRKKASA